VITDDIGDGTRRLTMAKYLLLKHYRGSPDRTDYGSIPMED